MLQGVMRASALWRPLTASILAFGLAMPIVMPPSALGQEELPATAAAAPADTVLFHSMDLDWEGEEWQQTEALLARAGIPDALDVWREEVLTQGAEAGDFSEADLDALIGGEMAIIAGPTAVKRLVSRHMMDAMGHDQDAMAMTEAEATPMAGADEAYGVTAVLIPGDPDAAWDYAERQINAFAAERGLEVQEGQHASADLIWTEGDSGAAIDGSSDPMEELFGKNGHGAFAAGRSGDFIIAAKTPSDVTAIVDVIEGSVDSLASSESARAIVAELPANPISFTYIDSQAILASLGNDVMASLQSMMPPDMPMESMGGYSGLAISVSDVGFRLDSVSKLSDGADASSLLVPNDPATVAAAERAPSGTFIFEAGKLPPNAFAGAAIGVAQAITATDDGSADDPMAALPSPEEIEAQLAEANAMLGFDLQADLFDLLGDDFILFASFPSFGIDGVSFDAVAAVDTTDPVALAMTMRKVAALIDRSAPEADVSVRRVGADTLYVLSDPSTEGAPAVELGVVGDQAIAAVGSGVDQLSAAPGASLADDEQFQLVMGELPADYYQVVYVDIGQAVTPIMMLMGEAGAAAMADADPACAAFESQALAQDAYDTDQIANSNLDLDFDGEACEDAFSESGSASSSGGFENIRALGMVAYEIENGAGASAVLYIAEPGS